MLNKENSEHIWDYPEKYLSLDETGELHLKWLINRFALLRLVQRLPIFDKAHKVMTERGNFSRRKAFGEMHGDCYMWVERCVHSKVICYENQNARYIYIQPKNSFHIRKLDYKYNFPVKDEWRQAKLKTFKNTDFIKTNKNPAYCYGDLRDEGYVASTDSMFAIEGLLYDLKLKAMANKTSLDFTNCWTLPAIGQMDFWEPYLDDADNTLE